MIDLKNENLNKANVCWEEGFEAVLIFAENNIEKEEFRLTKQEFAIFSANIQKVYNAIKDFMGE